MEGRFMSSIYYIDLFNEAGLRVFHKVGNDRLLL